MVSSERKKEIADNIDKLIYDFIPDLDGVKIPKETKLKIVEYTLEDLAENESKREKLFISLPQPFLADWVCKHKNEIKDLVNNEQSD